MIKIHLLKRSSLAILAIGATLAARAQQDPYFTHYMFNKQLFNPAAVGASGEWCLSALSHYQYVGYEDRTPEFWQQSNNQFGDKVKNTGPKTQAFTFSAPIMSKGKNKGGVGFSVFNDKLGYELNTNFRVAGAYRFDVGGNGSNLAIGVDAGMLQKGFTGKFFPLVANDPNVPTPGSKQMKPTFSAGLYYQNPNLSNLYVGLSATNLKSQKYAYGLAQVETKTHIYATAGIEKASFLGNPDLTFKPSVLVKYNTKMQFDLTALADYRSSLSGGLAYRTLSDAISVLLGYKFNNGSMKGLRVGYSYDLTLTKIINVSSGSHELALNYCFQVEVPEKVVIPILTPRFMKRDPTIE